MVLLAAAEIFPRGFREIRKVDRIDALPNLLPVFLEVINLATKFVSEVFPHCSGVPSRVFSSAGLQRVVLLTTQDEISFLSIIPKKK